MKKKHIITLSVCLALLLAVGALAIFKPWSGAPDPNASDANLVELVQTDPSAVIKSDPSTADKPAPQASFEPLPSPSLAPSAIEETDGNANDIQDGVDPYQTQPSPPPPPVPSGDITNPDAPPTYPSDEVTATTTVTPIPEVTPPPKKDGTPKDGDRKVVDGVTYEYNGLLPPYGWIELKPNVVEDSPNVPVDDPDKIVGHFG
ncbi:hypothetical protein FACS18949_10510 [Clostridia bacterium]|nr:hypothetical protein FACS18949_10510 [Clostridia bacterium]